MKLMISEILKQCGEISQRQKKIEFLRKNYSPALGTILKYTYDPNLKFLLPEGPVPYTPSNVVENHGMLYSEARKLYLFVEGGHPNLTQIKRETLFIQLLESINEKEAVLLCAVKDKDMSRLYPSVNYELVNETFPGLLPPKTVVVEKQQMEADPPKKRGRPKKTG